MREWSHSRFHQRAGGGSSGLGKSSPRDLDGGRGEDRKGKLFDEAVASYFCSKVCVHTQSNTLTSWVLLS